MEKETPELLKSKDYLWMALVLRITAKTPQSSQYFVGLETIRCVTKKRLFRNRWHLYDSIMDIEKNVIHLQ